MLLDYLVTTAGIGAFSPILTRVRQRVDPNPSIYDSAWLLGDSLPFFDRHVPDLSWCKSSLIWTAIIPGPPRDTGLTHVTDGAVGMPEVVDFDFSIMFIIEEIVVFHCPWWCSAKWPAS